MLSHSLLIEFIAIGIFGFLLQNHCFQEKINVFVPCNLFCTESLYIVREQASIRMEKVFDNTAIIIYSQYVAVL